MFCAISGQTTNFPVFAPKTGLIYEEQLLRKAVESNGGVCPISGVKLSILNDDGEARDIFPVKTSSITAPRPSSCSSFPAILDTLRNEWDSLLLEQIELRKELLETRKDLATALYEREAASGVIAQLLKENGTLKDELSSMGRSTAESTIENNAISERDELSNVVETTETSLRQARTKFAKTDSPSQQTVPLSGVMWKEEISLTPHKSSKPGASCMAIESYDVSKGEHPANRWVVSGGVNGLLKKLLMC